jgi:hypothetical protein
MNAHPVSPFRIVARIVLPLILLLAAASSVSALERSAYSLEVLVNGRPLSEYADRGTNYIEAIEGREYSIRLRNHTNRRIAVALSVDGLNTIDAKETTAKAASKWILGPYETVTLDGWQTGSKTARRFFFTTEEKSYGAWLGKTRNLGLITAAVFREKVKPVPIHHSRRQKTTRPSARDESGLGSPAAPKAGEFEMKSQEGAADRAAEPQAELSDDLAATGIGREVDHRVRRVRFDMESSPAAVLELRYEYHDALVRLGVLPPSYTCREDPLDRRERARGFEDMDFAPDPFRSPRP